MTSFRLTKLVRLIPGSKTDTSEKIADRFIKGWYCRGFGITESITSDRDSRFTSTLWTAVCQQLQISKVMSTARHQQTDGQSEIAIRTYKRTARKFASYKNQSWVDQLALLEYALNNSVSASTGFTPFYLAYGFNPRSFNEEYLVSDTETPDLLKTVHKSITKAREAMTAAQETQRKFYDRKRRTATSPLMGSLVMLSAAGISWPASSEVPASTLPTFLGPFTVLSVDADLQNVRLDLPTTMKIYPVFHISLVKPYYEPSQSFPLRAVPFPEPAPVVTPEGDQLFEIEAILDKRVRQHVVQYLVQWKGYSAAHNLWIPFIPSSPSNVVSWQSDWDLLYDFDSSIGSSSTV